MAKAIIKTETPLHLLLGSEAVRTFEEEGIDTLIELINRGNITMAEYETIVVTDGDDLFRVLQMMEGYFNYLLISEEEYIKIKSI